MKLLSRHLGNALIIIAECIALRDDILIIIYNGFTNYGLLY